MYVCVRDREIDRKGEKYLLCSCICSSYCCCLFCRRCFYFVRVRECVCMFVCVSECVCEWAARVYVCVCVCVCVPEPAHFCGSNKRNARKSCNVFSHSPSEKTRKVRRSLAIATETNSPPQALLV